MPKPPVLPRGGFIVRINGFDMYCEVEGEGPFLVFLPGAMVCVDVFRPLVEAFRKRFTVLTADASGQGRSALGAGPITYVSMADDLVRLFDHLGIAEADCFGIGDGGACGLQLLIDFSDRVRSASLSSTAFSHWCYTAFGKDFIRRMPELVKSPTGILKVFYDVYAQVSPAPERFMEMAGRVARTWASAPNFNKAMLATIEKPTLVISSDRDDFVTEAAFRRLAACIPGARLAHFPGMAHVPGVFRDAVAGAVAMFVGAV